MSIADSLAHDPLRNEFEQVIDPVQGDDPAMLGGLLPQGVKEERDVHLAPAPEEEDEDDLFGDGDGDEDGDEEKLEYPDIDDQEGRTLPEPDERDLDGLTSPERRRRKELEYEEESGEEEDVRRMTTAEVDAPRLPVLQASDGKYWMLHLPNYVSIDSKPYDPLSYTGPEMTDPEVLAAPTPEAKAQKVQEMSHFIQYQVKNALRWRWARGEDGMMKKVSNSRVVRWSDGTLSFQVGTEFWDVTQNPEDAPTSRDTSFAVVQMEAPGILQSVRSLTGSMALRPTGLNSRTHRDLVRAIGQKHSKVAKLLMTEDGERAPEAVLRDLLREENKAAAKRRTRERVADGLTPRRKKRKEMWSDEEEAEDEDEVGGGRKESARNAGKERRAGSYEEDDFLVKDDEDEEGEGEEEEEEEEEERGRGRGRGKRKRYEDEEGKDEMELAEDKIERAERERKRRRRSGEGEEHPAEEDEPESEEDRAGEEE